MAGNPARQGTREGIAMTDWTQGPWAHRSVLDFGEFEISGAGGEEVALVHATDGADEPTYYPSEANARLIAAAPDMYEALNVVREWMLKEENSDLTGSDRVFRYVYDALAKADGRNA